METTDRHGRHGRPYLQVKMIGTVKQPKTWLRQFPGGRPIWGRCEFLFDPAAREYDWLVVYNDLPDVCGHEERLACPGRHTILTTTEPSTIKAYGNAFTAQFGHVLTSQADWALPHPSRIFSQPALQWFYGLGRERLLGYDEMFARPPLEKSKELSTVCSTKRMRHTLHSRRYAFTWALKKTIPQMDVYGLGVRPMADKAEALAEYQYHLAIENFIGEHHWTEKLSDVFLGAALPFYAGCPNAGDYFPEESFIPIDLRDVEGAGEIILRAIRDDEYRKRLPYILEARRLVFEKHNIFAVLSREIERRHASAGGGGDGGSILSRRLLRRKNPWIAVHHVWEKSRLRILHALDG
jgi:hypothetical protein